jgi:hypothetical protein
MNTLPNTNELLRAAESAQTNDERLAAYEERKLLQKTDKLFQDMSELDAKWRKVWKRTKAFLESDFPY